MCAQVWQPEGVCVGGCRCAPSDYAHSHSFCTHTHPTCPVCATSLWMPRWMKTWSPTGPVAGEPRAGAGAAGSTGGPSRG